MAKIGISIKLDVTKIDKSRIFEGKKGRYLDLTTFIDTSNEGEYGDHGFISQSTSKEERESGVQTPILGNVKVFFSDMDASLMKQQAPPPQAPQAPSAPQQPSPAAGGFDDFDDDIPF